MMQAQFRGKEYVITQPIDSTMSVLEVEQILKVEYGLLCLGDFFKKEFDMHASTNDTHTIPGLY
jgi:hypothetical protein